ncbi:MAG: DUF3859 domain-containing protein [Gammaproteobacteria bacterium]|jgi:hypothetical protein|nr:DUF3859 domain-containing protein [Gammaproteobacteria bacterium]
MNKVQLSIALLSIMITGCSTVSVSNFSLIEFGTVQTKLDKLSETDDPNFTDMNDVKFEKMLSESNHIPAKLGTEFGFRFEIIGEPSGEYITVECAGTHPDLTNPHNGQSFSSYRYTDKYVIGRTVYYGFSFDEEWEIAPGTWILSIFYKEEKMLEKEFHVYIP